ncbi:glycogen debranching N-terminal domain-containing protein [Phenylobacterium sp.]|jgi:glycogen debranching enzyme|uniref:amylo-alpha-1,6-glucosidase n=1 Tax=Phenylobacterium sp. TaxID=1871053 RepID=UPI002E35263A|nr:glycogen debranching N-terminal domain-containing protein [Phenylobacterium sp.]HEX4709602.1 glycogen debranching N-terminal domain-containing protein [Phenylobacterium sp.]
MAAEITVGPPRLAINQGHSFLLTDEDGQIAARTDKGLYDLDTRLISSWRIYANGVPWRLLNSANIAYYASRVFLLNQEIPSEGGGIPAGSLALTLSRTIGRGLHEDLDLVNHGADPVQFNLEIAIRSDFADLFEVKRGRIVRRGRIQSEWVPRARRLDTRYVNGDFRRSLSIEIRRAGSRPVYANGRISFDIALDPGEAWHACLIYEFTGQPGRAPESCVEGVHDSHLASRLDAWEAGVVKLQTGNEEFYRYYQQAVADMAALRLPFAGTDHMQFVPAAGVPWFVCLFGRDSLIVSLQNAMIYPDFARGALDVLGRYQADKRDDWRDAEPGKIMHELRTGELAHFKLIPHTPYYGTADATPLYLIVLHTAWRSTGDHGLLERYLPVAERCLTWIDRYGDRDKDGFQEYQTRSDAGYENQGWKDSGEALVYPDGSLVKGPKALCELQGYVYDAWLRMADIYDALGRRAKAGRLRRKAAELFERFNDVFWDEASGFYAFALDGEKAKVMSVASNPGHCLWSGIVPPDRAGRVVKRLMAPDMWTGWGIRTLSSDHPAYNPNSYQNGSVWPHDNGLIALGFRRYGFVEEAALVARGISGAAAYFQQHQLPELYAGLSRSPTTFPVQYLGANTPQAWAAGSCFSLLQMLLGFQPDAPNGVLYLDPALPDWMPDLIVRDVRIDEMSFDLRFWRDGGATLWEVLKGDPSRVRPLAFASGPALACPPAESRAGEDARTCARRHGVLT